MKTHLLKPNDLIKVKGKMYLVLALQDNQLLCECIHTHKHTFNLDDIEKIVFDSKNQKTIFDDEVSKAINKRLQSLYEQLNIKGLTLTQIKNIKRNISREKAKSIILSAPQQNTLFRSFKL